MSESDCGSGNDYDGRMGLRISSIFVIGFGSMLGALLPIFAARSKSMRIPKMAFFIVKYFGSGVIVATAFIHLLVPAHEALDSDCLEGAIKDYSWVEGIVLMTIFVMFFVELMAMRFDIFGGGHSHDSDVEGAIPVTAVARGHSHSSQRKSDTHGGEDNHASDATDGEVIHSADDHSSMISSPNVKEQYTDNPAVRTPSNYPVRGDEVSYPPGGADHLGHQRTHNEAEHYAAQMTGIFILEFGVIFHSIFIGLTLAVSGEEFVVLYIVLVFHQTFEGLGLGSRLGTLEWPKSKAWLPWAMGMAYGVTTPISIAVGLGVRQTLSPGDPKMLLVNGVFDSISAGILIYTGLVELMAHEFMFNQEMRKSSLGMVLCAFGCMVLGAGLMALLGKWA